MNSKAKNPRSADGRSGEKSKSAADADARRSFASDKFDWLDGVAIDPRLPQAGTFKVAYCIIQHVNSGTGVAILSDAVIHEKTNVSIPQVKRHRAALRDAGWLDWKTRKGANHYRLRSGPLGRATDLAILRREARKDLQKARRNKLREVSPATLGNGSKVSPAIPAKSSKVSPASLPEVSPVTLREVSPATYIHLCDYTAGITPSGEGLSTGRTDLEFIDGPTDVEPPLPAAAIERRYPAVENPRFAELELLDLLGDDDRGVQVADLISDDTYRKLLDRLVLGRLVTSDLDSARQEAREAARGEP